MTPSAPVWRPRLPGWSDDILPFYGWLAGELEPRDSVAEIGVAWGRSLLYLAESLIRLEKRSVQVYGIDPWDPEWSYPPQTTPRAALQWPSPPMLRTLVANATDEEIAMVHLVRASSARASRLFDTGELGAVFVDGNHTEDAVTIDLALWSRRVRSRGWLSGHDYDPIGFPGVVRAVDRFVSAQADFEALEVRGTVWIARRRT